MTFDQQNKLKLFKKIRIKIMGSIGKKYPDVRKAISKELDLLEYKEVYRK